MKLQFISASPRPSRLETPAQSCLELERRRVAIVRRGIKNHGGTKFWDTDGNQIEVSVVFTCFQLNENVSSPGLKRILSGEVFLRVFSNSFEFM